MNLRQGLNLIIQLLLIPFTYSLKITSVIWTYDNGDYFKSVTDDFNEYAKEKGLDLELEFNLFSPLNTTHNFVNEYDSTIDYLLTRKSNKYDIYFYDVQYSRKYSEHFIDLYDYLDKKHLDMYENGVAADICKYNGKWVGLPLYINYSVLHSNLALLEKYGQSIPKTWDQLLQTADIVLKGEAAEGNTDIIGYNGLIPDNESCTCTIQELIYSFRENKDSPFPGYNSQEAIDALNKYKEIMNKVSSPEAFYNDDSFSIISIFTQSVLFSKFWYIPIEFPGYSKTVLVGKNDGVSGTTIGGYNIGICKYIEDDHRRAALKALEFFTSKDYQKKFITETKVFSAMNDIYDDEEVCEKTDCNFIKQFQPIARPSFQTDDYDDFSTKLIKNVVEFFHGNITASEALSNIEDVIKFYDISINPKETIIGLVSLISTILFILIMIASSIFICKESLKPAFTFLTNDLWLVVLCGCILLMCTNFMELGTITNIKCNVRFLLQVYGFVFTFTPFIYSLYLYFPIKNSLVNWVESNKYLFILLVAGINTLLCGLSFISPLKALDKKIDNGKNFRICKGSSFPVIFFVEEIIIFIIISICAFLEWNLKKASKDVRSLLYSSFIFMLLSVLSIIIDGLNINNYSAFYTIHYLIGTLIALTNYILLYCIRLFWVIKPEDEELDNIKESIRSSQSTKSNGNINNVGSESVLSKVISCHYSTGEVDEQDNKRSTVISTKSATTTTEVQPNNNEL